VEGEGHRPAVAARAGALAGVAGVVYLTVAAAPGCRFEPSRYPHHILTADAFLHGQTWLRGEVLDEFFARIHSRDRRIIELQFPGRPAEEVERRVLRAMAHDFAIHDGRFYTYWGPLTPAVMVPFVAVFGPAVSDRWITALFGAANAGLMYWLLRRVDRSGLLRITEPACLGLTLLLSFGTVHFYLSCGGQVWHSVQIVTLTALLGAMIAAVSRRDSPGTWAAAGGLFGAAVLGRGIVLLLGPFFAILLWIRQRGLQRPVRRCATRGLAFVGPLMAAGCLQLAYNYARFGNAFETGEGVTVRTGGEARFIRDYEEYGSFDLHFLPRNLWYYFANWRARPGTGFDPHGNSMFLITPPLVYVLLAWRRRETRRLALALGAGVAPLLAALLLYRATGYFQFGNRYLLDAMPMLLLLVAIGTGGRIGFVGGALMAAAAAVHTWGTLRFYRERTGLLAELPLWVWLVAAAMATFALWAWRSWGVSDRGGGSPGPCDPRPRT